MIKRAALFVFLAVLALSPAAGNVSVAYAQETEIALVSEQVTDTFPEGVVFEASAETAAPAQVKEIKLQMKVKGSNRSSYAYLEFTPATTVQGKYLLKTSGAQYKPPGTLIEYNFVITDSEERTLETPKETHLYLDSRFEWSRVSEGMVEVYYYGPTKTRAETIMQAGADAFEKMGALLGAARSETVRILVYNSSRDLIPAQPFESQASERELLLEGVTFPEYDVFLMIGGVGRPDGVASHEMTHVVVGEALKNSFVSIPVWLNEGLAEYGNVNRDTGFATLLSQAIAQNSVSPLRNLQTPPGIANERLVMYGQGYSVVAFMVDTYGAEKMGALFAAFNEGQRIDAALQSVYGFDQDGLDNAWRASVGLPPVEKPPPDATSAPAPPTPATTAPTTAADTGQPLPASIIIVIIAAVAVVVGLVVFVLLRRDSRRASSGQ